MRIRRLIGLVAVLVLPPPSFELPPPAPEGKWVVVHGGVDSWWVEGLPPRTLAHPPGETLLLHFEEVETREALRSSLGVLRRSGPWLVLVLEGYEGGGDPRCGRCGCGCTAECGPAGLCGSWLPGDGWYYPASPEVLLAERKPPLPPPDPGPACWGERLMMQYCVACHSMEETNAPGPSLGAALHLGAERVLSDGRRVTVDQDYLRRAILDPKKDRVAGYDALAMPRFRFSDNQLEAITAFLLETPKERELRDCRNGCVWF